MPARLVQLCIIACAIGSPLARTSSAQPSAAADTNVTIPRIWASMNPQARLMAQRAARVDARLRLAERIKGLRLTPTVLVRDFMAESDLLTTALRDVLRGAAEVATNLCSDQPLAESTLRLPGEQVAHAVKMLHQQYYKGTAITPQAIDQLTATISQNDIEATGVGLPPRVYLAELAAGGGRTIPSWATGFVEAAAQTSADAGGAIDPLPAARKAEATARRVLADKIAKLPGFSKQTVGELAASNTRIQAGVAALVREAPVSHTRLDDTFAEVTLRIPGARLLSVVRPNAGPPQP